MPIPSDLVIVQQYLNEYINNNYSWYSNHAKYIKVKSDF